MHLYTYRWKLFVRYESRSPRVGVRALLRRFVLARCRIDLFRCVNEHVRPNERKNARTNARRQTNEGTDERTRTSERTNQQTTKQQTKARTNERTSNTKIMAKSLPGRLQNAPGTSPERPKSTKNRSKALLARSWAILGRSGRARAAPEALSDALGTVPGRSRDVPGMAWDASGRPWDVSKTPRRALGTSFSRDLSQKACRKARRTIFVRFCVACVLSRDSSDVHETSVLVGPKHYRSMFAAHEHAHARASKKQLFRPRKSTLEAPKRRPGEPGTHQDRCAERPNHPDARRPTENLAKERTLERSNAVSNPWSRC